MAVMVPITTRAAGPAPVDLGSAAHFTILAGSGITSTGGGTNTGDVGLSPTTGTAITGLTTGQVNGIIYTVDGTGPAGATADPGLLSTAKVDLATAYSNAAGRASPDVVDPGSGDIGGMTLVPGLYKFTSSAYVTGSDVTLAGGPADVWIFQIGTTLIVGNGIHVLLADGAQARNVFWQVGSSATLGTSCSFKGTIMADQSITMDTSSTLEGRALAQNAAVTFNGSGVNLPQDSQAPATIGDYTWLDANGNGTQDVAEVGLSNVVVTLYDTNAAAAATTTSSVSGAYAFTNVLPGIYTVAFAPPLGYLFTTSNVGGDDTRDSDPLAGTNRTAAYTLTPRETNDTVDAGFYRALLDIAVTKGVNQAHPATNAIVWYTVTVTNLGPSDASGVEVTEYWPPANILFMSATPSQGSYDSTTGVWRAGALAASGSASLILTGQVTAASGGSVAVNTATLTHLDQQDTNAANNSGTAGVTTLAQITRLDAVEENGAVVVEWETASELDTAGFYLYRLREDGTPSAPVTDRFLPGLLTAPQGGVYRLVDAGAVPGGTYTYMLMEVECHGARISHGPYVVTVPPRGSGTASAPSYADAVVSSNPFSRQAHGLPPPDDSSTAMVGGRRLSARLVTVGERVRITVTESGLYSLGASEMGLRLGVSAAHLMQLIGGRQVHLTCQGRAVAWLPVSDGLCFYGEPLGGSIYSRENVYWLQANAPGVTMAASTGAEPVPDGARQAVTETVSFEENHWATTALYSDPERDFWIWDYVTSGSPGADRKTFAFWLNGCTAAEGPAGIRVVLKGATESGRNPDHHVRLILNGTPIAEQWWDGTDTCELSVPLDNRLLTSGSNRLEMIGALDAGVPYSLFCMNSFDVTHQRLAQGLGDRLLFCAEGPETIAIDGFTDAGVRVLDVTDPWKPVIMAATRIDASGGGYRVSFRPVAAGNRYLAVAPPGVMTPASVRGVSLPGLKDSRNRADYVLVAPPGLEEAAAILANYRTARGMHTQVVALEGIYDEFNCGIASPHAIRAFLGCAYRTWDTRPRYVVLVGQGTYDYRNYGGYNQCLVPPLMIRTDVGLFASDMGLADVDGDGLPEMAIGRLPVLTAGELTGIAGKITAYEAGGLWKNRMMMVADNPDRGGNFPADSDALLGLMGPDLPVDRIFLSELGLPNTRAAIAHGMNQGARVFNYIGHAGMDRMANEGILTLPDVAALRNGTTAPLVLAMTCILNRFDIPGLDSLGESLVRNGSGAVGVVAPVSAVFNADSAVLNRELTAQLCRIGPSRIGDALTAALHRGADRAWTPERLQTYVLLGDPATAVGDPQWATPTGPDERDSRPLAFGEWQRLNFAPVEISAGLSTERASDADGDGMSNWMEYLLALDPRDGRLESGLSVVLARAAADGPRGEFSLALFLRRTASGSLSVTVEVCDDLVAPRWRTTAHTVTSTRDAGMGMEEVTLAFDEPPNPAGILYARIKVSE